MIRRGTSSVPVRLTDTSEVFFAARHFRIHICLGVGVDMADDVDDAVGVGPFHKIDAHAGILFSAAHRIELRFFV